MADIQNGTKAIVWGLPDPTVQLNGKRADFSTSISNVSMGYVLQSVSVNLTASEAKTYNEAGELVNVTMYNPVKRVELTVRPVGASKSAAAGYNYLPAPGTRAALIDVGTTTYNDSDISAASTGIEYRVVSSSKSPSMNNPSQITIVLEREGTAITDYDALS